MRNPVARGCMSVSWRRCNHPATIDACPVTRLLGTLPISTEYSWGASGTRNQSEQHVMVTICLGLLEVYDTVAMLGI